MSILDQAQAQLATLSEHNRAFMKHYPGEPAARQPVHTVYGGAQLFRAETTQRLGELAVRHMDGYARDALEFAEGVGFIRELPVRASAAQLMAAWERDPTSLRQELPNAWLAFTVYERVKRKLQSEAVEDFRIDFEDGFGARPDAEEDAAAIEAAKQVALGMSQAVLPPFIGIRIKSFGEDNVRRGARTLELFLDTLLTEAGRLPPNFVVTLPKVYLAEQPRTLVRLFEFLERRHQLPEGTLKLELMIEVTQALIGADGKTPLPEFLKACEGRCTAAHFGTYDFTASCNITAAFQTMAHPWCDLAKGMMMLAYAGTGIFLSDGATNVMPVGPHNGSALSQEQTEQNRVVVHSAWQLASRHIHHSLAGGFYQGWDLHPGQLPVRYATCYGFFLEGFAQAAERLRHFIEEAAHATLVGDVFDDAATGQGLLNYFLRARNCGAIDLKDLEQTGLTLEEFGLRSFAKILEARRQRLTTAQP